MDADAVRRRFDWAVRNGNSWWLWPEISIGEWQDALVRIEAVTRQILTAGNASDRLTGCPEAIGIAGFTSGMGPLLGHWLGEGRLQAEAEVAAILDLHFRHNSTRMQRMADRASAIVAGLAHKGVPVLVLKGMQTAFTCFPTPGARPLSDIDLAIRPGDQPRAAAALREMDFVPGPALRGPPPQQTWSSISAPAEPRCLAFTHADNPWAVDLQTSLTRRYSSGSPLIRLDGLWTDGTTEGWALSATGAALAPAAQALHLACHAGCGFINLSMLRLCELALLVRHGRGGAGFDWDEFAELARRLDVLASAYPALSLVEMLAPGTVPEGVLAAGRSEAPAAVLRVLGRLSPGSAQRIHRCSLEERFMWTPSRWRVALESVRDLVAPATSLGSLLSIQKQRFFRVLRGTVVWSSHDVC
jgi:hypothetical protein